MDDDVAELAVLRRRAYGPDADIDVDPAAVARLDELEALVRLRFAARSAAVPKPATADAPAPAEVSRPSSGHSRAHPLRRMAVAGAAAVAVVCGVLVGAQATGGGQPAALLPAAQSASAGEVTTGAAASKSLLAEIPMDRSLARVVPQPTPPPFPAVGAMKWAETIGPYFGWAVWVGRSEGGLICVVLERSGRTHGRCVSEDDYLHGRLAAVLPYAEVAPEHRPAPLRIGQSIAYRWLASRGVSIVIEESDLAFVRDRGSSVHSDLVG